MNTCTPRWTYTDANASRWRPLFDDLLANEQPLEIPLAENAKTLTSLKVRVCDGLKWLADQYAATSSDTFKPYAELKKRIRFLAGQGCLVLQLRRACPVFRQQAPSLPPANGKPTAANLDDIKLEPWLILRLAATVQNSQEPLAKRTQLAAVLLRELSKRKEDPALVAGGVDVPGTIEKAQQVLLLAVNHVGGSGGS